MGKHSKNTPESLNVNTSTSTVIKNQSNPTPSSPTKRNPFTTSQSFENLSIKNDTFITIPPTPIKTSSPNNNQVPQRISSSQNRNSFQPSEGIPYFQSPASSSFKSAATGLSIHVANSNLDHNEKTDKMIKIPDKIQQKFTLIDPYLVSPSHPTIENATTIHRVKSLSKSERAMPREKTTMGMTSKPNRKCEPWMFWVNMVTCCYPEILLEKCGGMKNKLVRTAWREKMGLVTIFCILMLLLGFITFGFTETLCKRSDDALTIHWDQVNDYSKNFMVINIHVLNMTRFLEFDHVNYPPGTRSNVLVRIGKDATLYFSSTLENQALANTLIQNYTIGNVADTSIGCIMSDMILWIGLLLILGVVFIRFFLAMFFSWFISRKLGELKKIKLTDKQIRAARKSNLKKEPSPIASEYTDEIYTILLVTCYSEGDEGIRATLDSLAATTYKDSHKCLFIVSDGIITGSGNAKSTPDIILDMLEVDQTWDVDPKGYVAIGSGSKARNMARVYVAWYNHKGHRVPTVLIVKCGTAEESENNIKLNGKGKPGNRGKRDSQIILMNFFRKVMFDDKMSPLEYDLFIKLSYLMGVTPDRFEIVLMVDADTNVAEDSLSRMVACMVLDPKIIGLCGETRIGNKAESWVSRIQVFEYYLSHHLTKAFESIFGGVTCLPGCFCMWRIKAAKENGYWTPILCNPDIVKIYSENNVDTLHKKNLLLLGEDRFMTTLMLGTFPQRKLIFVPKAYCKTTVPAQFKVLLSQRRRWINSTIHNLFELVLVRELCGVFCFSMQFIIGLELVGTVTLPAAITFTTYLLARSIYIIIVKPVGEVIPYIPLGLLAAILLLPGVLILLTSSRFVYIYWMIVYLFALPIWNFALPAYAFWHFDDFSWGETRKVEGGSKTDNHGENDGKVSSEVIVEKKWIEWEKQKILKQHLQKNNLQESKLNDSSVSSSTLN